ncbi:unnamed protein product [Meloidogyne enterolobii]|uniref:Uncharacterized protein n=1 Tax=Meloidogyne enterolobii TaxID=390850 RepID=A0ACB1AJE1_MELEN
MNIKAIIPEYVKTDNFIIKIFQIFYGVIVHSRIECLKWEGLCFKEVCHNIVGIINFVIIILNTSLYVLNFLKVNTAKFEKYCTIICNIGLVVAIGFRQRYLIKIYRSVLLSITDSTTMFICFIIFLFIWEYLLLTNKELNSNEVRNNNDNEGNLKNERNRLKLIQIIIGYGTCTLLVYGGRSFFNAVLNLLNAIINRMERLCSVIGVILFIIAFGIITWYLIEYEIGRNYVIFLKALIGIQMTAFIWDYQILGQAF